MAKSIYFRLICLFLLLLLGVSEPGIVVAYVVVVVAGAAIAVAAA